MPIARKQNSKNKSKGIFGWTFKISYKTALSGEIRTAEKTDTQTSKIHLHVEQSSLLTTWRLTERLFYNQGCKKDLHQVGWQGRRSNQVTILTGDRRIGECHRLGDTSRGLRGSSHILGTPTLGSTPKEESWTVSPSKFMGWSPSHLHFSSGGLEQITLLLEPLLYHLKNEDINSIFQATVSI